MHSSDAFIPKYSELVYNGFWSSPEREALQALASETQRDWPGATNKGWAAFLPPALLQACR